MFNVVWNSSIIHLMLYFSPKSFIVSSRSLNSRAIPKEIIIEGTIRLETVIRNKKLEIRNKK